MAEIKASFFIECEELLEGLQDGLQEMDDGQSDSETVNVVFRAVHSIKGGAGAFGLDNLVEFAHHFETALDEVRTGKLIADQNVLKLFFQCSDLLADLIREARDGDPHEVSRTAPAVANLSKLVGDTASQQEEDVDFQPMALSLDLSSFETADPASPTPGYQITFNPENELYALGNEPLFLLRALRDLGDIEVSCESDGLPSLEDLDPETGHMTWKIKLETSEAETAVTEVFEFVEGICILEVSTLDAPLSSLCNDLPPFENLTTGGNPPFPDLPPLPAALSTSESFSMPQEPPEEQKSATDGDQTAPVSPPTAEPKRPSPVTLPKGPTKPASGSTTPRATVRVDLERIDRLVNLVGEIVINQAMLTQSVEEAGLPPNSTVRTGLEEFLQLTRDIQESVMMIRAQPVKSLFQRMGRIVREASAAIGKDVRLNTDGENTEVDKTVIERLADPLTHMIRNAVDHGLEENRDREARGKPSQGQVSLSATHRSGRVVIEVSDDGAGINREKVHKLAVEKGLVPADLQLTESEIDNLLFLPGFSTASEVSNLSGRGVGMDVVRSAIQALGGRISISSEQGKGTTFSISLPLTLAVLDGMIVTVAKETLVVPLNSILETLTLTGPDLKEFGPETQVVNIRNTFVPLLDLGAELGYREPLDSYTGTVALLITQEDGSRAALVVDAIDDQRQVVIKGLQDSYGRVPGIAAATILGDGKIALILDPVDLVSKASGRTRPASTHATIAG
ncbi:two-component system, chemotaxis family, sensor kinase CheA [Aliiroseovarius crassostreae]|uniref:Chemotaxis protein CheA n=2 Tax=Aliiroseovarius crassostreae TaxID=154981 RepID=A0A0P7IV99_9RHOB|nr:chemotaxis protein CheA [Aliiroseovarius crassostreae]SFU94273.1 two-component system, chemotaxis family, sensor kinase CheA [Aliiroseovarius crassostreae]